MLATNKNDTIKILFPKFLQKNHLYQGKVTFFGHDRVEKVCIIGLSPLKKSLFFEKCVMPPQRHNFFLDFPTFFDLVTNRK